MKKSFPFLQIMKQLLLHYLALEAILGFLGLFLLIGISGLPNEAIFPALFGLLGVLELAWYVLWRKRITQVTVTVNAAIFGLTALTVTAVMVLSQGNPESRLALLPSLVHLPMLPTWFLSQLMNPTAAFFGPAVMALFAPVFSLAVYKGRAAWKPLCVLLGVGLVLAGINFLFYVNRPQVKYGGHGFDYMNGYSSTDFSDYKVYSDPSRLAVLDAPSQLRLEEDLPVMDGAEACYPLYAAVAKAVYVGIEDLERGTETEFDNGNVVRFTNSIQGFYWLLEGEVDLFFGAKPAQYQLGEARAQGINLKITPIGKEGFVFFVEEDFPLDDISSEDLRAIYAGTITNWSQVGGPDREIRAFQRPQGSGSQTMMEYFMDGTPLRQPQTYEVFNSMEGVISQVAQYHSEDGALGYSFRYFVEELNQEGGVKLLKIDGVAPTVENIKNGTYPLTVPLELVTKADNENPNVEKMIDFLLGPQGQELVEKTGYAPLTNNG